MKTTQSVTTAVMADQYVTFSLGNEVYGLPIHHVREIIRPPKITVVPLAPKYIEGVTNLRGSIVQIMNGRILFNLQSTAKSKQTRIIVLMKEQRQLGYVVDRINGVENIESGSIDNYEDNESKQRWIEGVAKNKKNASIIMLLNTDELFSHTHSLTSTMQKKQDSSYDNHREHGNKVVLQRDQERERNNQVTVNKEVDIRQFVRFGVGHEEYGLSISDVRDIVRLPEKIDRLPGAPSYFLGLGLLRNQILPIFQMSKLLGIKASNSDNRSRVIIVHVHHGEKSYAAGLLVDSVSEILRLYASDVMPLPEVLRTKKTESIEGVCQFTEKKQIMYVVNLLTLIPWSEVEQFMVDQQVRADKETGDGIITPNLHIKKDNKKVSTHQQDLHLIFRIADEEFGLPVSQVKEILRVPEILSIPHAPEYIRGIANLRGQLITVLDLRVRLGLEPIQIVGQQRIIIAEQKNQYIGLIVDSIREVQKIRIKDIEECEVTAPDHDYANYLSGIAKLSDHRMVMLLHLKVVCLGKNDSLDE
ncbi:chemotaxis protein CheW [Heliorestis convoluta]|uniref:Chemotaxis signal transduction protein CheW n=1 Tax=Heliorestis convoluta TaxID=356322 RepID=A0A5Q2N1M9_9FIRM|nr:chemotaxis protein CheW [Heliorestis convoluta]QGG46445.1 chemotaxis signal transduction protein CheW [Heliorestis convoluta]